MDGMTQPLAIPQTIADAIEAVVQERVVAALATEKECRLAMTVKLEGDAFQRGYAEALTAVEAAWGDLMLRLWRGCEGDRSGVVVQLRPQPPVTALARLSEFDAMLVEQGAKAPEPEDIVAYGPATL
jgi:hypothetical protein